MREQFVECLALCLVERSVEAFQRRSNAPERRRRGIRDDLEASEPLKGSGLSVVDRAASLEFFATSRTCFVSSMSDFYIQRRTDAW